MIKNTRLRIAVFLMLFAAVGALAFLFSGENNFLTGGVVSSETLFETINVNNNVIDGEKIVLNNSVVSLRVTGSFKGNGSAKVYAVSGDKKLLVYEFKKEEGSSSSPTGFVVFEEQNSGSGNETEESESLKYYVENERELNESSEISEKQNQTHLSQESYPENSPELILSENENLSEIAEEILIESADESSEISSENIISNDVSENLSDNVSDVVPETIFDNMSDNLSDNISDNLFDTVPDNLSDLSEQNIQNFTEENTEEVIRVNVTDNIADDVNDENVNLSDLIVEEIAEDNLFNLSNLSVSIDDVLDENLSAVNESSENEYSEMPENSNLSLSVNVEDGCAETCSLFPFQAEYILFEISDGELYVENIKYALPENGFYFENNLSGINLSIGTFKIINLGNYFSGSDIFYDFTSSEGYSYEISQSSLKIMGLKEGSWMGKVYAVKDDVIVESNEFEIIVENPLLFNISKILAENMDMNVSEEKNSSIVLDESIFSLINESVDSVANDLPFNVSEEIINIISENESTKIRIIVKYRENSNPSSLNEYVEDARASSALLLSENTVSELKSQKEEKYARLENLIAEKAVLEENINLKKGVSAEIPIGRSEGEEVLETEIVSDEELDRGINEPAESTPELTITESITAEPSAAETAELEIISPEEISEEVLLEQKEIMQSELIEEIIALNAQIENVTFAEKVLFADEIIVQKSLLDANIESVLMDVNNLELLKNNPDIEGVYVDAPVSLLLEDSKEIIRLEETKEYALDNLDLELNGSGVKICFVDTGANSAFVNYSYGYDFVNNDNLPEDEHGHGTSVGYVFNSISPGAEIVAVKVINSSGQGYESDIIAGLQYCLDENADVVSLSIGGGEYEGYCDDSLVAQKVDELVNSGIAVFASTGNDGYSNMIKSPACARGAIRVGASTKQDALWENTNYNNATLLLAPGAEINTIGLNGEYVSVSGTSMSSPMAASVASLLLGTDSFSPQEIYERLVHTGYVINISEDNFEREFARVDALNAILNNITNNLSEGNVGIEGTNGTFGVLADISACSNLSYANIYYNLTQNVSSTGTCFNITAANVTLDCRGYWINYSLGGVTDTYGVYTNQFNTTIRNCTIVDGNWTSTNTDRYGIYLDTSDNSTLFNNSIITNNSAGIYLGDDANFNNLTLNRVDTNNLNLGWGIALADGGGSYNTLENNNITSGSNGIIMFSSSYNTLINNVAICKFNARGLFIQSSSNNNVLINNTFENIDTSGGSSSYGIQDYGDVNNTYINNTAKSVGRSGTAISDSSYLTFIGHESTTSGGSGTRYGIYIYGGNNNSFRDCRNISGGTLDVALTNSTSRSSLNNTFVNCSYTTESVENASSYLIRKWYYRAYVNNTEGLALANANVSAYNSSGALQFTVLTNSSGWIDRQEVIEYVNLGGTKQYYSNYTINASLIRHLNDNNTFNFTSQQNKVDDVFTLQEFDVVGENACGTLNTIGETYVLVDNVSSQGTCFTVNRPNVTLDCNGYWITYSINGTADTYGVYSGQFNTTVKNCNIIDGNWTSVLNSRYGLVLTGSDYATVYNNSVNVSNSTAIYLAFGNSFNNVTRNIGASYYRGLYFSGDNSTFTDNIAIGNYTHGFDVGSDGANNIFINNSGTSVTGTGLYIANRANNNSFVNCTGISASSHGVTISGASFNVFSGLTSKALSGFNRAISLSSANHSLFRDCSNISGYYPVYVQAGSVSINDTFINCSYITSDESVAAGSEIIRKWYYLANVTNSSGSAISGAAVNITNRSSVNVYSNTTGVSGLISRVELEEYTNAGGTRYYPSNYTVNVSMNLYYSNQSTFNLTLRNNSVVNYTLYMLPTSLISCGTLSIANGEYKLLNNVTSAGTCFNVTAANVTLDCEGYSINYTGASGAIFSGLYSNQFNTTVKNCKIDNFTIGVFFDDADNGTIENNVINVYNNVTLSNLEAEYSSEFNHVSSAILIYFEANYNMIRNNTVYSRYGPGIYFFYDVHNNTIDGCNATSEFYPGIYLYGMYDLMYNTIIKNSFASSNHSHGIMIFGGHNTNVSNSVATSVSDNAIQFEYGFDTFASNLTGISNESNGIIIFGIENFILSNSTGITHTEGLAAGIYIDYYSNYVVIFNSTGRAHTEGIGIRFNSNQGITNSVINASIGIANNYYAIVMGGDNNTLINSLGNSSAGVGLNILGSNHTVSNSTFISSSGRGVFMEQLSDSRFDKINSSGTHGYYLDYANNISISDCVYTSGTTDDVELYSYSENVVFLNCTYDTELFENANNMLIRKWYFDANVAYGNGTPVNGANVTVYNSSSSVVFSALTNSSGDITRGELTEYIHDDDGTYYSTPHNATANVTDYAYNSSIIYNLTALHNVFAIFSLGEDTVSPTITFLPPTPNNNSVVNSSSQSIVAEINDNSNDNTSAWIDFDRSLIGYWAMDYYNSSGIYDNSTYDNFGTFTGGLSSSNITPGVRGQALTFDGLSNYVNLEDINNMGNSFTLALWSNTRGNGMSNDSGLFFQINDPWGAEGGSGFGIYQYFIEGLGLYTYARMGNYSDQWRENGPSIEFAPLNTWRHYTIVRNYPYLASYVNGVLVDNMSFPYTINSNWDNVHLGIMWSGGETSFFNGSLDEVMLFNRSLSSEEVLALYDSSANMFNASFTNLSERSYNYTVYAVDESGNFVSSGLRNFSYSDATPPTFVQIGTNSTVVGQSILFSIRVTDNVALQSNGQYIFSNNDSGVWTNSSPVNFTTTPQIVTVTKTLNSSSMGYRWYFTDNKGNLVATPVYDVIAPSITINHPTGTFGDVTPLINVSISETGTIWYNINNGANITLCTSCTASQSEFLYVEENSYTIYVYANDTVGNLNSSSEEFTVDFNGVFFDDFDDISNLDSLGGASVSRGNITANSGGGSIANLVSRYRFNNATDLGYDSEENNPFLAVNIDSDPAQNSTVPPGRTGYSVYLDGNDGFNNDDPTFNSSLNHTVCLWARGDIDNAGLLFAQYCTYDMESSADNDYNFVSNNCAEGGSVRDTTGVPNVLYPGVWTHICQRYNASSYGVDIVINGTQRSYDTLTDPIVDVGNSWHIGSCGNNCSMYSGNLYDVMWFDSYLTDEEVENIYDGTIDIYETSITSKTINISDNIDEFGNVSWTEFGTDATHTVSVEVSIDNGATWIEATNNEALTGLGSLNDLIKFRINLSGDGSVSFGISNITLDWSSEISSITYSDVSVNQSSAGQPSLFSINVTDEIALHPNGQYIFSTNNEGIWINDSPVNFTSTPSWANVTKTFNLTPGIVISYMWYFTSNSSNSTHTPIYTVRESSAVGLSSCGNITSSGVYFLTSNVSSNRTCFNVTAANVTLDCDGYWINYTGASSNVFSGVYSNQFNTTIKNCKVDNFTIGVFFNGADNGIIENNNITLYNNNTISISDFSLTPRTSGILIYNSADYNIIRNNKVYSHYGTGIYINDAKSNTIINCNSTSHFYPGIKFYSNVYGENNGVNNSIIDSYALSDEQSGIWIGWYGGNHSVINSTGISNGGSYYVYGILSNYAGGNRIINSTGQANQGDGINFEATENGYIYNSTGISEMDGNGIHIASSSHNNLISNSTGISNIWGGYGIAIRGGSVPSSNNTLEDSKGISYEYAGIFLGGDNNTIRRNNATGYIGYSVSNLNNSVISDCIYTFGDTYDVELVNNLGISSNVTFLNCSYSTAKENVAAGSNMTRKWYYQAYTNYSNGTAIAGANISAYNTTGNLQITSLTNSTGYIPRREVIEYVNTGGARSHYSNYTTNAIYNGDIITRKHNLSVENNIFDNFTFKNYALQISSPTTASPLSVSSGNNISVYFNFTEDGVNLTSGVDIDSVFIGGVNASIIQSSSGSSPVSDNESWTPSTDYATYQGQNSGWYIATSATLCINDANDQCACYDSDGNDNSYDNISKQSDLDMSGCEEGTANLTITRMENAGTLEPDDCIRVSFSNDGGSTYGGLTVVGSCDDAGFVGGSATVSIPDAYLTSQFRMRFSAYNDNGGTGESMCMDELIVACDGTDPQRAFVYIPGIGWQVNVTVPTFDEGLKDLFVNATYTDATLDNFTRYNTQVSAINYGTIQCGELNETGATYNLTSNVSSTGTCFNVTAANVTLDCGGYWINYSTGGVADTYGVYTNQFNTTVRNCNVVDGNWESANTDRYGVYLYTGDNSTLFNNSVITNSSAGIVLDNGANFNNLTLNRVDTNNLTLGWGIAFLSGCFYNNLVDNNITSASNGIIFFGSSHNNLINNVAISDSARGLFIQGGSNNNTLINNTFEGTSASETSSYGIQDSDSINNTYINNTAKSVVRSGTFIDDSSDLIFIGHTSTTSGASGYRYGIWVYSGNNTLFRDCKNISGGTYDVSVLNSTSPSLNNTFVNCSYTTESVENASSYLVRKWYFVANVTNSSGGALSGAGVNVTNRTSVNVYSNTTGLDGLVGRAELVEYTNVGGTKYYPSNYTVNVSRNGYYSNQSTFNLSLRNNSFVNYSLYLLPGYISNCGALSTAGATYTLADNVSSTGTCFNINAANITLDCNGYWINYSTSGSATKGVTSDRFNTTIKNCNVIDGNLSATSIYRNGIYLNANYGLVQNNSVTTNNSMAIYFFYSSNVSLINNYAESNSSTGLLLIGSSNIMVTNNTGESRDENGIFVRESNNITLINNTGITNADNSYIGGIGLYSSGNSTLINCTGISGNSSYGLYIDRSENNNIINSSGTTNSGYGFALYISSNNTFINPTAIGLLAGSRGIYASNSRNLIFRDCVNVTGVSYDVRFVSGSINNTFINCSYNSSKEELLSGNELIRKWYYQASTNYTNGTAIAGANISAYNNSGDLQFTELTNSGGVISRREIIDYVNTGGTRAYYSNYTFNASYSVYNLNFSHNITTETNVIDAFIFPTNSPPPKVVLVYPGNGNDTFFDRVPTFVWEEAIDPDDDELTYQINVSRSDNFSDSAYSKSGISTTSQQYDLSSPPEMEFDDYYWRVRAYDGQTYGEWSDTWNFTLWSSPSIILIVNNITFPSMNPALSNNTLNDDPLPFIIQSDSNTYVNVHMNISNSIWTTQPLNTHYWQIRVRPIEAGQEGSFDNSTSLTTFFNATNVTNLVRHLNYSSTSNNVSVDINFTVPTYEPPGQKISSIYFVAEVDS